MNELINTLEQYSFLNNTSWDYIVAFVILLGALIILKLFQMLILSWLKRLAKRTKNDLDDAFVEALSKIKPRLYIIVSVYIAFRYLIFSETVNKIIFLLFLIIVAEGLIRAIGQLLDYAIRRYMKNKSGEAEEEGVDPHSNAMVRILRNLAVIVLWIVVLLFLLSNLGINVTSVLASLGVGGIAVALAMQNILSDLFSSFSIFIDKPFLVGDFIQVGADSGTVEKIGLKSTRIRTQQGEELVVSNKELTSVRVQNFKKLEKRRDVFTFGVVYGLTQTKLKEIPKIVKEVIRKEKNVKFDRCYLINFGDSSLDFEVVYFVGSNDYKVFLNTKQSIMLGIYARLAKEDIGFAYPTTVVHLEKDNIG